ncbi:Cyclic nucleotide-binding domain-containing protein [Luteibacter sp. UNC138MFCol5.1]|uniref:TIR domain-containing protein n=1 Tax=Luteibacter sp. UNC138MFCol5.1 TaxID=1502774 RepID=UPI0008B95817|nr:TIR domain-containing protein [Luteibacter sp. UNC138MFCol5.1]SEO46202.1 Cyclic nucleotide-binding domain-containing protein [Luteibacter sp. UNC138MFCol5.1]
MKERYEDPTALKEALLGQRIVQGDAALADALMSEGSLVEFQPGETVITQGTFDRDVYLLLSGAVRIIINGVRHHTRTKGDTIGEMSALNASIARSATLESEGLSVAFKVDGPRFVALLNEHPQAWPRLASELAARIEQRNQYVNPTNRRPRVFIISSLEGKEIANAIQQGLEYEDIAVEAWDDHNIFPPGAYVLETLEKEVASADFGIAIVSPDDLVRARDRVQPAPRDNVIFELGFFVSRLGRHRTLLLTPRGAPDTKIPSDYKGIVPISYKEASADQKLASAIKPTVIQIINVIKERGMRASYQVAQ